MDMGFIDFTQAIHMVGSGSRGSAMGVVFIVVKMEASIVGSSKGVSNMDLAATILEAETHMPGSILQTKCMVLVYTVLQMGIDTRVLGMKEEDKDLVCIHLETETHNPVTGKMGFSEIHFFSESSTSVSHAKLLKAVQEARRMAEKAVGVAEVDERLNRIITAANRAANAAAQNQIQIPDETGGLLLPIVS